MDVFSEIASRILAELEEAHAENVTSTMNTVLAVSGDQTDLAQFQSALQELIESNLVRLAYAVDHTGKLEPVSAADSLRDVWQLPKLVKFSATDNLWIWDKAHPRAEILATREGLAKAQAILEGRGYQWWRQDS